MNQNTKATIALVLLSGLSLAGAQAQTPPDRKPPSPEELQKVMDATMGAMVPAMGRMAEAMIDAQLRSAERPETAEKIAAFKKNLLDALLKKGFSARDALQIVIATSPPSAAPTTR